jgi:hypothetical protein
MGGRRKGATRTAVVAAVVLLITSACGGKSERTNSRLENVNWPELRTLGVAQIETDSAYTWVRTLVPSESGGNLFAVDADTLSVTEVPIKQRLELIVAGEGQLWTLSDDGHTLSFVNESTQEMHRRTLDPSCGELADPSGVVSSHMLWLSCNGSISAYTPTGGGHKRPAPRSTQLLTSSDGVWALVDNSLIGIGGAAAGRRISIPAKGEARLWQSSGDEAWAIDLNSLNKALIRVQLTSGTSSTFTAPTEGDQIDDFTLGTDDIWVALRDKPTLLRLDRQQPSRLLDQLDLQAELPSDDSQLFLAATKSSAWIEIYGDHQTKLLLAHP